MPYIDQAFDALGDPTRRAIFNRLRGGPLSVGELATGLDVTRPAVSQHLAVLKAARLATSRPEGTRRLYAVDRRGVEALRNWLGAFWDQALASFKAAAERQAVEERTS
ncbi:MAG: ArsR/SmtB family transcription factor [Candidatus Acidiferrales bacterium]